MIKRIFKIKPLFILMVTLVTGFAMAAANQTGQESPSGIGAQEIIEDLDTITTKAISIIVQAPEAAPKAADLVALLDATHQRIREDLKQNMETFFHMPLQPRALVHKSSDDKAMIEALTLREREQSHGGENREQRQPWRWLTGGNG